MSRIKEIWERHTKKQRFGYDISTKHLTTMSFDQFEKALSELGVWMSDSEIEDFVQERFPDSPFFDARNDMARKYAAIAMKHYRDNASPVRFVTDSEIEEIVTNKYAEIAERNAMIGIHMLELHNRMRDEEIKNCKWMRDLIFKKDE